MSKTKRNENEYESQAERIVTTSKGRRKKKRVGEKLMVVGAIAMVLAIAYFGLQQALKVKNILVENPSDIYTDAEITRASGLEKEDSLLKINKKLAAEKICRALPYIGSAEVAVAFPDTVTLRVTYTAASVAVSSPSGYTLLNDAGKVLQTAVPLLPDDTALLSGAVLLAAVPGETAEFEGEHTLEYVTLLTQAFEENGIGGVTALNLADPSNVVVELNNNTDVRLGAVSKAAGKLAFGREVINRTLTQARGTSAKLVIDLTLDGSAFVRTQDDIDAAEAMRDTTEPLTDENGLPVGQSELSSEAAGQEEQPSAEAPTEENASAEETEPKGSVG